MNGSPHLGVAVLLIVVGAGALHACWNAIAKKVDDRLMAFAMIGIASTTGGGVTLAVTGFPASAAIGFAIASAAIHNVYDLALISSYRRGAFNQAYPIARGTSPLLVAIGAYALAGERLDGAVLAGIAILAGGLVSLALSAGRLARADLPAVGTAAFTGLTIASYTLVDGLGVRHAQDPLAYAGLLFFVMGPPMTLVAALRRPGGTWRSPGMWGSGLLAGGLSLVAYGVVLWAQTRAPLAVVAAVRETSVIFAALIGAVFLRERFGARRVLAAVAIAVGIVLIGV